jgi:long-chain acyl-CoA synthetase
MENIDTLPKYLLRNFLQWGDREVAIRKKRYGIWNEYTWKDHYEHIKYFSLGLIFLGLEKGEKVSILGDANPEWTWAQVGTMAAGGVAVGLFTDSLPIEIKYILAHSDTKFLVAHDQEQVDKILEIKEDLPSLKKVIYWEPKGMRSYQDPILAYFYNVVEMGKEFEKNHPGHFEKLISNSSGDDIATLYYTSGTTGLPRGVMITQKALIRTQEGALQVSPAKQNDNYVAILPPAWMASFMSESGHLLRGMIITIQKNPRRP